MVDFTNVSVIIPTVRDSITTPDTVPSEAEIVIRRDDGLNTARNMGVRAASNDWIVIADDDINFPTETVDEAIQRMDHMTLAGLADFKPLRWIIGRLMIFHRELWEQVGGFDESRHHGGDTDFAIRIETSGGKILRLDREAVPHFDEDTGLSMATVNHFEWMFYLVRRHPVKFGPVATKLTYRKIFQ
jgi:GT2 family glycosyltransferase